MEYNNALNYMVIAKNRYERIENAWLYYSLISSYSHLFHGL
jgi:hypothetical protein